MSPADQIVIVFHGKDGISQNTKSVTFDRFYREVLFEPGTVWYRIWMRSGGWLRIHHQDKIRTMYQIITNWPSPEWAYATIYDAYLNPNGTPPWTIAPAEGIFDGI